MIPFKRASACRIVNGQQRAGETGYMNAAQNDIPDIRQNDPFFAGAGDVQQRQAPNGFLRSHFNRFSQSREII
jgi:hypothetical protein